MKKLAIYLKIIFHRVTKLNQKQLLKQKMTSFHLKSSGAQEIISPNKHIECRNAAMSHKCF